MIRINNMNERESPKEDRSPAGLYTVADLIRMAFYGKYSFRVNFRLIHIVLLVLARKLNILQRMVNVKTSSVEPGKKEKMSIVETKLYAQKNTNTQASLKDFEKERIYIVYEPPDEAEALAKESDAQRSTPYTLSLTTQESYLKLFEKINEIQQHFGLTSDASKGSALMLKSDSRKTLNIIARRLEKTERSVTDLLGSLVVLREKAINKEPDDESIDPIIKDASPVWGFKDTNTDVFVMRETADVRNPFGTGKTEHTIDENAAQLDDGELKDGEVNPEEENSDEENPEEKPELGEGETDESIAKHVNIIYEDAKPVFVPDPAISMEILKHCLQKIKRETGKEFRKRLVKIKERHNEARERFCQIKDRVFALDVRTRKKTVNDIIEPMIFHCKETQDAVDKKLDNALEGCEQFLNEMDSQLVHGVEKFQDTVNLMNSDVELTESIHETTQYVTAMCEQLGVDQKTTAVGQYKFAKKYKQLVLDVRELNDLKCTRIEFDNIMESKVGLFELNNKVATNTYFQQINDVYKQLDRKIAKIENHKMIWQREIDNLHDKHIQIITQQQLEFLKDDIELNLRMLGGRLYAMIEIVKPFERAKEKLARAIEMDECMVCSSRLSKTILKRFERGAGDSKTSLRCVKKDPKDKKARKTICVPLTPIMTESRSSICAAHRQKPCEDCEEKDVTATLESILHTTSIKKNEIYDSDEKQFEEKLLVQIPCKPCNKPKNSRESVMKSD